MSADREGPGTTDLPQTPADETDLEQRVRELLSRMTLHEKIGQMNQVNSYGPSAVDHLRHAIQAGSVGSVLNEVDVGVVSELQRVAVEESRLGIPLLFGRDVIHGFRTAMPIPLGQAATWNPELVRECARVAAWEAAAAGINWTFAPMIDVTREPRWGRIAESPGEDAYLAGRMAAAMVRGFQGDTPGAPGSILACAKHFAGYGAVEAGRDYASTNIPRNEFLNHYLPPFKAAVDAGVGTIMSSFSDVDGVPATGNASLLRTILRDDWGFDGFVVSDWDSVRQLSIHGLSANDRESALEAASAGVDMEMVGGSYLAYLADLIETGAIEEAVIDEMVANILRIKLRSGVFDHPYPRPSALPPIGSEAALATARKAALESVVLLKNDRAALPLAADAIESLAVIGPLADAPYDQLGTWMFDGDANFSVTPLTALQERLAGSVSVRYVRAMDTSRSRASAAFDEAEVEARETDATVLFLGEEAILSGEAHCRADIGLPGDQVELVRRVAQAGKPVIAVIMAGRPLTLTDIVDHVDAILFAWHPGTMAGPALADLLFGVESPSGKLPVTFPRMVGQVPIYYNHKNTGKPPTRETTVHMDDIDPLAPQNSVGMTSFHLDAGFTPLFPFGHGLSYGDFHFADIDIDRVDVPLGNSFRVSVSLTNRGTVAAEEVVQLYVRDLVGSVTRPVRELKRFRRVRLEPGAQTTVEFELDTGDLAFYNRDGKQVTEPGEFDVWIGGSSQATLGTRFRVVA